MIVDVIVIGDVIVVVHVNVNADVIVIVAVHVSVNGDVIVIGDPRGEGDRFRRR